MYNNPYFMNPGLQGARGLGRLGLFSSIRSLNWGNLLSNAQKTLGVINQAIPIAYQIKPMMNNAKTMFRVLGAMRDSGNEKTVNNTSSNTISENTNSNSTTTANQPMFFI